MVGRLVEDHEVRRIEQHARDDQPRALPARERPDSLVDLVARKLERPEEIAQHANRVVREVFLHLLPDGEILVEQLQRLLGEVAHRQARAERERARVGRHAPAIIVSSVVLPAPFRPSPTTVRRAAR